MNCWNSVEQEVVHDCPRITKALFQRKEWKGIYEEEAYHQSCFPLECILLNRCYGTLKALLECTKIPIQEAVLRLAIEMREAKSFQLLIYSQNISEDVDWIFLTVAATMSIQNKNSEKSREILGLLVRYFVKNNRTSLLTTSVLKWLRKETIQELYNIALKEGNAKFAEILLKLSDLPTL